MSLNLTLHSFQVGQHLGCALITEVTIFLKGFFNDGLHAERKIWIQLRSRNRIVLKNRAEYHGGAFPSKWQRASEHFVQHRAKGKKIRACVQFPCTGLFWRHIRNCAERRPWAGEVLFIDLTQGPGACQAGGGKGDFCQSKIENLRVSTLGDENIPWLDIAMDDPLRVRHLKRIGDFDGNGKRGFNIYRTATDAMFQRQAIKKFHCNEALTTVLPNFINRADSGMI